MSEDTRPLILHVVYRFDTGGLENGVVNLINHMDPGAYRHAVLALTEVTDFARRIKRADVRFIALHKRPGHGFWLYPRLYRLFRELRPALVHTRNLAALEAVVPAWLAGVPVRVHGEHGRDVSDLDGSHRGYQRLRRAYGHFVHRFVALSCELAGYLRDRAGIPAAKISQIYNGVDTQRFPARGEAREPLPGSPFDAPGLIVVGTAGRLQAVKDPLTLVRAFAQARALRPELRERLRLALAGEGALRGALQDEIAALGLAGLVWLAGERADVPEFLRSLDIFVLPSLAEGVSNTILEAMASGLPVVATEVGGNAELLQDGITGHLVPAADPAAIAARLVELAEDPARCRAMGRAGRARVEQRFALAVMVSAYRGLYDELLQARAPARLTHSTKS